MRSVDSDILAALESRELILVDLLDMEIGSTNYRYTLLDVPVVLGDGKEFTPRGFEVSSINYSSARIVDTCRVSIANLDDLLTPAFVGGQPQGSDVTLSRTILDGTTLHPINGTEVVIFEGEIDSWESATEDALDLTLVSKYSRWTEQTLRRHSASCGWTVFGGTECGYSGGGSCDRTYRRCAVLANTAAFGGFRWLPSIEGAEVWWGRNPSGNSTSSGSAPATTFSLFRR
jgi:hypothetical protein